MIVVGLNHSGYNERRNISGLPHEDVLFRRCYDFFSISDHIYFRAFGDINPLLFNTFSDLGFNRGIDCFHFFNGISFGSKPWISTFESRLPRVGHFEKALSEKYVMRLASSSCKAIIAMSDCAAAMQRRWLTQHFANHSEEILRKTHIVQPSQALARLEARKSDSGILNLLMVGHHFFRKGGVEVLQVIDQLLHAGRLIKLTIVSSLTPDTYDGLVKASDLDIFAARSLINAWPKNIQLFITLPNSAVMQLLQKVDLALLPSLAETYGYFVLEAQAHGVPVITTNVRAFPEINPSNSGWMIELDLDENRNAILTGNSFFKAKSIIRRRLLEILEDVLISRHTIGEKGLKARERIRDLHDPVRAAECLSHIYSAGLR